MPYQPLTGEKHGISTPHGRKTCHINPSREKNMPYQPLTGEKHAISTPHGRKTCHINPSREKNMPYQLLTGEKHAISTPQGEKHTISTPHGRKTCHINLSREKNMPCINPSREKNIPYQPLTGEKHAISTPQGEKHTISTPHGRKTCHINPSREKNMPCINPSREKNMPCQPLLIKTFSIFDFRKHKLPHLDSFFAESSCARFTDILHSWPVREQTRTMCVLGCFNKLVFAGSYFYMTYSSVNNSTNQKERFGKLNDNYLNFSGKHRPQVKRLCF